MIFFIQMGLKKNLIFLFGLKMFTETPPALVKFEISLLFYSFNSFFVLFLTCLCDIGFLPSSTVYVAYLST